MEDYKRVLSIALLIIMCCNQTLVYCRQMKVNFSQTNGNGHPENFYHDYQRLDKIHKYIDAIANNRSSITSVFSIGTSVEGRKLKVIKIGSNLLQPKPSIWIDGGTHAREWITPATTTYIADRLVNEYSKNKDLVDHFHWYILPVLNPDGYEYSHENEKNRFWRKNRNPRNKTCPGVDLNRNWDFHWNEGGASQDACSDIYSGPTAFSEPETRAVAEFILAEKKRTKFVAYFSMHSFGQTWLIPWGWTKDYSSDYEDIKEVAEIAVKASAKVNGTKYDIQPSVKYSGISSGTSDDWAKGAAGIKYSYTVELPDTGHYGFALPVKKIEVVAQETWQAITAFARTVMEKNEIYDL